MRRPLSSQHGFALVLTLVVTALMVAVVVELVHQVYVDTSLSRGFRDGQQASLLAESGVTGGSKLLQLVLAKHPDYTSLSDEWAAPLKLDDETGTIEVTVVEESGKINLNDLVSASGEYDPFTLAALKRLGKRLQIPDECWASLADWLDGNDETRSGGAESPYYRSLKTPYGARNGRLSSLSELSLVKGFSPELISRLRPFVTLYAGQPGAPFSQININTAPKEVIAALDDRIGDSLADRVIEQRQLQPFRSTGEFSRVPGFDTIAIGLVGRASVKGLVFRIRSVARVSEAARSVEAVVRPGVDVLSWQEF